ncbi:hypothetical protein [Alteromonas sp. OM2203]|uniref:hypothetical protein n=1 Tax=Alteromonas sp. OM2203 TaxID=3398817 RepID=UPI003AF3A00D|tara:strand:+ start:2491 stop:3045 length:555 start_codon:yes stop_codon:yes gene_type:complete
MSDKNFDPGMEGTCELKEAWADGKKLYYVEDIPGLLEQIACLNKQLAAANVCVAEVETRKEALEESLNGCTEKVLSLSGKLAKANERVRELEIIASDRAVFILNGVEYGYINLPTDEPEDKANLTYALCKLEDGCALNKFAIEKKIEMIEEVINDCQSYSLDGVILIGGVKAKLEQLRKEQEHG